MQTFRSIFLSDTHVGIRWSKEEMLAEMLESVQCRHLYLLGDIIEGWRLRKNKSLPQAGNTILRHILKHSRESSITYIPGNHDEFMDVFTGYTFGNISIRERDEHTTADGRRFVLLHGDEFDLAVRYGYLLSRFGNVAYSGTLWLSAFLNRFRSLLGMEYWSLAQYLKDRVKDRVTAASDFENALVAEARYRGAQGIICGHIHRPSLRDMQGLRYGNCGDWIEHCTVIVERENGHLELMQWKDSETGLVPYRD
ncbi:MAG: UDP-2,3-diacylglucosamine diphosphatase [Synergistales bacterium]|nr:UDP-2,3-diacylglucosamine diphosphatase [Synergistales bacterium]